MKLSTDQKLFTENGEHIGNLSRYVLDPKTKKVAFIVFKHGLVEPTEFVISMNLVDHVDDEGIHLKNLHVSKLDDLTRFMEDDYIITDEHAMLDKGYVSDAMISNYYYYPSLPFGSMGIMPPIETYTDSPSTTAPTPTQMGIPVEGEEPVIDQKKENIPSEDFALREGARVLSSDEKHLGNVDQIIIDPDDDRITHLVISRGLLLKERKVIPIDWVYNADADNVYLTMKSDFMQHLPDYKANK